MDRDIVRKRLIWYLQNSIPKKSKPGVPYSKLGACNADIIENHQGFLVDAAMKRIEVLSTLDPNKDYTAVELIQLGACDPVRVFIKKEPHSQRKFRSKRWRLIFAISIVDQLVERILSTAQNKKEIATWLYCPSAPGLSLTKDEDLNDIYQKIQDLRKNKPCAEADITGWDWSVKEWELKHEAEMRIKLGNFNPYAANICRMRFLCVSRSVYAFPNGELRILKGHGVQLSGCYNTSSTNSRLRVLVALLCGASWAMAMGDDCVEEHIDGAEEKYGDLGHPLKMYNMKTTDFEFCSMLFKEDTAYPVDGTKTLYRLIEQKEITKELVMQFELEMRKSPRLNEFRACYQRVVEQNILRKNKLQEHAQEIETKQKEATQS